MQRTDFAVGVSVFFMTIRVGSVRLSRMGSTEVMGSQRLVIHGLAPQVSELPVAA